MDGIMDAKMDRRDFLRFSSILMGAGVLSDLPFPTGEFEIERADVEVDTNVHQQQGTDQRRQKMSFLFIGKYNGKYPYLGKEEGQQPDPKTGCTADQTKAKEAAKRLFGFEYDSAPPEGGPLSGNPSGEVDMQVAHAFLFNRADHLRLGWMAIVSNDTYGKMMQILDWPYGPFCRMFDIEVIALNDDEKAPKLQDVYAYMTPASWGPTLSA